MSMDVGQSGSTSLDPTGLVAEEIRALMGRRRMTGRELARRLHVSPSWVSYRLTGSQPIDVNDLMLIARELGVTMATLLPREQREPTPTYGQPGVPPRLQPQAMTVGVGSRWSPPPQPVKPGPRVRTTLTGL